MKSKIERNMRLVSGLFIAFFLVLHLLNSSLGIVSLAAMDGLGSILFKFWSIPVFTVLLYTAFVVHIGLMFVALYRRRSFRMPIWNWIQIGLGLALPILLVGHVVGTRGVYVVLDIQPNYSNVVALLWSDPVRVVRQFVLVAIAWAHMSMGIHFWLRHKRWYPRWVPLFYPLCLFIPLLAYLGFTRTGIESLQGQSSSQAFQQFSEKMSHVDPALRDQLQSLGDQVLAALGLLLLLLFIIRAIRGIVNNKRSGYTITHTAIGKSIQGHRGQTVLEALRESRIPHASVCGGRGRCTTCRVRISESGDLHEPEALESSALQRVDAGPNVRLACQLRPTGDITITPVLHPRTTAPEVHLPTRVAGHEQQVVCMFVDMRDSTMLGEQKMPYDVVFILNQYFNQLTDALRFTDGHYATFTGDGLMALYGLNCNLERGCRNALQGAVEIRRRMETLNVWLAAELNEPLRVGIGIHCGEAIVGTMGPPDAPIVSAIGDTVNIAARLESLSKELATDLVVSEAVLLEAGVDYADLTRHSVQVRGREHSLPIFSVDDPDIINKWVAATLA